MTTSNDLVEALVPVVEGMERLGVTYRIGGSVASAVLGVPRSTLDVDVVCDLGEPQVERFVAALERDYYVDREAVRAAVHTRRPFNLIHLTTMLKVDVFVVRDGAFDRVSFERHVDRALSDAPNARRFAFRAPEDVILRKLEWYRPGGEVSERHWADVVGVLRVQGDALDFAYLRRWAPDLGVLDLVERALVETRGEEA